MRSFVCSLFCALAPTLAMADVLEVPGQVLEEAELDRTLISKPGWLRGLHLLGQTPLDVGQPTLRGALPKSWAGDVICARITTIGGDYTAVVQFNLPPDYESNSAAEFLAPAQQNLAPGLQNTALSKLTPDNSGVSLERGPCISADGDASKTREFIPNIWNEGLTPIIVDGQFVQIVLNMNIARADELVFEAKLNDVPLTASCEKLTDPSALAFNYKCAILMDRADYTTESTQTIDVSYMRIHRGRNSKPRKAAILVGAGQ